MLKRTMFGDTACGPRGERTRPQPMLSSRGERKRTRVARRIVLALASKTQKSTRILIRHKCPRQTLAADQHGPVATHPRELQPSRLIFWAVACRGARTCRGLP